MTEKNYGGANSFGFKDKKALNKKQEISINSLPSREKKELSNSEMSKDVVENYLNAGKITKEVREYVKKIVKKDMLLLDLANKIEDKIIELGGKPAFPVNLSKDEIAAHYTPTLDDKEVVSGLLKVDFGVEIDGYIADNAISFDFSGNKKYSEMIEFNNKILNEALGKLEVNSPIKLIGKTIFENVQKDGRYKIIRNLSGHSLEKDQIHAGLTVSNTENENNLKLNDIAIAIEPFLTIGKGEIYEGKPSDIFMLQNLEKLPRDKDSRVLLNFIKENYRTKPFCKRWLLKEGLQKINFSMSLLVKEGIVYNFPVLIEKEKKPVSQAEHSVLFADKVYVYTN